MIRAMTEVKIREDEYQYAKALLSHVQGIPPGAVVTRDRKLLLHGRMILVNPNHTPSTTPRSGGNRQTARTSRLMEALESLEQAGQRSADSELYEGATSYFPDGLTAAALTRSPNLSHVASRTVQAIVFSDVLVLVDVGAGDVGEGQLMQEIGLSRVLGVHNAATDGTLTPLLSSEHELTRGRSQSVALPWIFCLAKSCSMAHLKKAAPASFARFICDPFLKTLVPLRTKTPG